jgi:D-sedoheptulose 7-phosphate isomerase
MLEQRIQQQFFESADLQNQAAELLSRPIAQAAETLVGCITAGGKLLVMGSDVGAALAPVIAASFTGRFERDRPPLAAIALRDDAPFSAAQQVAALGQPGDVLIVLDAGGASLGLMRAADTAHEREMTLVVLTGAGGAAWREHLTDTDTHIAVPHDRAPRVAETHLLVLHCLCDAVDLQLMGEQESA